jgi:hypothetical protein
MPNRPKPNRPMWMLSMRLARMPNPRMPNRPMHDRRVVVRVATSVRRPDADVAGRHGPGSRSPSGRDRRIRARRRGDTHRRAGMRPAAARTGRRRTKSCVTLPVGGRAVVSRHRGCLCQTPLSALGYVTSDRCDGGRVTWLVRRRGTAPVTSPRTTFRSAGVPPGVTPLPEPRTPRRLPRLHRHPLNHPDPARTAPRGGSTHSHGKPRRHRR